MFERITNCYFCRELLSFDTITSYKYCVKCNNNFSIALRVDGFLIEWAENYYTIYNFVSKHNICYIYDRIKAIRLKNTVELQEFNIDLNDCEIDTLVKFVEKYNRNLLFK